MSATGAADGMRRGTRWVALVRNVNLGRQGLTRDLLLDAGASAGGRDVRSYLTTGNLTLTADPAALDGPDGVVARLEDGLAQVLRRRELVAVRSVTWLRELLALDLFAGVDGAAWTTEVAFLRHDAVPLDPARLGDTRRTRVVAVRERELAASRPREGSAAPAVNPLLERATGVRSTARGWSTLSRIAADPG